MGSDALLAVLFNQHTIFICLAVYVVTYFLRKLVEGLGKVFGKKGSTAVSTRIWNELSLPILPILVGGLMGLMAKTFVWPEMTHGTVGGRVLYGAVCGMFSSFVYNRVRAWLKSSPGASPLANKFLPSEAPEPMSDPPPPAPVAIVDAELEAKPDSGEAVTTDAITTEIKK